jgi:hypothetical protein
MEIAMTKVARKNLRMGKHLHQRLVRGLPRPWIRFRTVMYGWRRLNRRLGALELGSGLHNAVHEDKI